MNRMNVAPLLAAYPALYLAAESPGQVTWPVLLATVAALVCAAFLALMLMRYLLRTTDAAGITTVLLVVLFFAYGPVHSAILETTSIASDDLVQSPATAKSLHRVMLASAVACLVIGMLVIRRLSDSTVHRLMGSLQVAILAILAFPLVQLGLQARADNASQSDQDIAPSGTSDDAPDIYYIIVDGYARADILRELYGFEDTGFVDALRARGFNVPNANTANYYWTFLSLSSSLNFGYLPDLLGGLDPSSKDRAPLFNAIRDSRLLRFLRARGYRAIHFQSTWEGTNSNPNSDTEIRCSSGAYTNEFLRALAASSMLGALTTRVPLDLAQCHLSNFNRLTHIGDGPGPKFVFAHFLPPHHPYLFDSSGRILRNATVSDQFEFQKHLWEDKGAYIEQLRFVNARILSAIDGILADSSRTPIIVLQSDHGPNLKNNLTLEQQMLVRFPNFAAFLLPGASPDLMPENGTPVNYFRRILNQYFDAGLPILADRNFYSTYDQPLALQEIYGVPSGQPRIINSTPGTTDAGR